MSTSRGVPAPTGSRDEGVPWHFGDPHGEQRALEAGRGSVDLSHHEVVTVSGPDRLRWLHDLTTAHLVDLQPGDSRLALILSPHGHVEHELHLVDDGRTAWIGVEPGTGESLVAYLRSMQFLLRVEVCGPARHGGRLGAGDCCAPGRSPHVARPGRLPDGRTSYSCRLRPGRSCRPVRAHPPG